MSSSDAPTPRDASGLPPSGPASSYFASHGQVFRRLESGVELVAEVYGADDSSGGEYETSGDSRAEYIARLLNDNPFPVGTRA